MKRKQHKRGGQIDLFEGTIGNVRPPAIRVFLGDELVVDSFAGGGGASTGIAAAFGRDPDIAINHDAEAIAMHKANHPNTVHYTESVWEVDPRVATQGKPVAFFWLSPDCKHFSKSKGGKPLDQKVRGLAWTAVRWATLAPPRVIALENVEEFVTWGPLHQQHTDGCCGTMTAHAAGCPNHHATDSRVTKVRNGRRVKKIRCVPRCRFLLCEKTSCRYQKPIIARRGETFRQFVAKLERKGYVVEWRTMRACDLGAPTTRRRLFLVARRDGRPIVWPEASHGPKKERPHRAAAEIIDWSQPMRSIFGRSKKLSDKTEARIARGIRRFVLECSRPFIVPVNHGGYTSDGRPRADHRVHDIDDPMPTVTAHGRGAHAVVTPVVVPYHAERRENEKSRARTLQEPLPTLDTSNRFALAAPLLARTAHGDVDAKGKRRGRGEHSVEEPLPTVTTSRDLALAVPYLVHRSNGERKGQAPRIYDIAKPLTTIVAQGQKHAFCEAKLEPAQRVAAWIAKHQGGNESAKGGQPVTKPLDTVVGRNNKALTVAHLMKFHGGEESHLTSCSSSLEEPVPTITAGGWKMAQVAAFLVKYNSNGDAESAEEPLSTITTKDRYGLVTVVIDGEEYVIVDILMRMLTPRELFRAQGFPDDYKIAPKGPKGKPLTKTAQIKMAGNSVPPPMSEAIARANLPELARAA